ncbi:UspA [Gossypium australe]|uniref:UspA n=1 Tax=Gossypium australe TaxID=47621 RepID=A0A5B6W3I7_9ROSI|nr:UspA [Gossypium australe]
MGRSHSGSPKLSLGRSLPRVRVHSPSLRRKSAANCFENDQQAAEFLGDGGDTDNLINNERGNKVMVVVDSSLESKAALEWALSYAIQDHDSIVLLVANPRRREWSNKKRNARAHELLHSMKNICQMNKPGVEVEVAKVEGKEKGPVIVDAAKQHKVSILVLGQRKRCVIWRLLRRWGGKRRGSGGGVVDYCIENAPSSCKTVAVRRKTNQLGGYLITTKLHKNFWLLA